MDSKKRFSSGDPSDSEPPPPKRPSLGVSPSSSRPTPSTKLLSSPASRLSPKDPSSSERGSSSEDPSPRDSASLDGSTTPSSVEVYPSIDPSPTSKDVSSPVDPASKVAHEPQPGASTIPPANAHDSNIPGLVGLTAIRQGDCYPAFLARGHDDPPTPPTSLTSSLEVQAPHDDTPVLLSNIDAAAYEPPVPWDPDEMLRCVGGVLQGGTHQPPDDDDLAI